MIIEMIVGITIIKMNINIIQYINKKAQKFKTIGMNPKVHNLYFMMMKFAPKVKKMIPQKILVRSKPMISQKEMITKKSKGQSQNLAQMIIKLMEKKMN